MVVFRAHPGEVDVLLLDLTMLPRVLEELADDLGHTRVLIVTGMDSVWREGGAWYVCSPLAPLDEGVRVVAWAPAPELFPPSKRYTTTLEILETFKHEERRAGAAEALETAAGIVEKEMGAPFRQAQKTPRPPGTRWIDHKLKGTDEGDQDAERFRDLAGALRGMADALDPPEDEE